MIHLEEYLDTLEALPMELQRQFTLMRELDALSQDIQDQMKQATEEFITNPPTKEDPRHAEYLKNFVQLFSTVLKHGEEKVALATQTYDLVDKHIRKLDDDLAKFEERQMSLPPRIPHSWGPAASQARETTEEDTAERRRGKAEENASGKKRRGNKEPSPPAQKAGTPNGRRGNSGRGSSAQGAAANSSAVSKNNVGSGGGDSTAKARGSNKVSTQDFSEMPIDPNEPRYCYCRQVSYGEMVACDDENCEIEWFHLGCVDLKAPPKGQWFCRECSQKHKRRREHHVS